MEDLDRTHFAHKLLPEEPSVCVCVCVWPASGTVWAIHNHLMSDHREFRSPQGLK
jgi:hypothetical protein